jgi:malate dehydrogenase (oxaloacetate-decarboxylating)
LDLPVFHDDQHGTAVVVVVVVVLAGLTNAALVLGRELTGLRVVVGGAGAAGVAISSILTGAGVRDLVVCDSRGIIGPDRDLPPHKEALARRTNPRRLRGGLAEALAGADVYIGVSGGTGRSDFPNQINNVLAFPGIFRGALDSGARRITENRKVAAAQAIAEVISHPGLPRRFPVCSIRESRPPSRVLSLLRRSPME